MPNWVHSVSSLLVVIFGSLASYDWSGLITPEHAGIVVAIIGAIKAIATTLSPSVPASTVTPAA